jgi:hypothetical protein
MVSLVNPGMPQRSNFNQISSEISALQTATQSFASAPGTATGVAGAATLNALSGVITTESLTLTSGTEHTLTLTNSQVAAGDLVLAMLYNGTNSAGAPHLRFATPGSGSITFIIRNATGTMNGTVKIGFVVIKA